MKPKNRPDSPSGPPSKKHRHRPRPMPKWLLLQQDLDQVARRRCLMMLSVLSGEKPVTDAITEAGISRGLYYQLEEKALRAMLRAMAPGAQESGDGTPGADGMAKHLTALEEKVSRLEAEKRRLERLLYVTRKVLPPGPVKSNNRGRRPKVTSGQSSKGPGPRPSSSSTKPSSTSTAPLTSGSPSSPPQAGGDAR